MPMQRYVLWGTCEEEGVVGEAAIAEAGAEDAIWLGDAS